MPKYLLLLPVLLTFLYSENEIEKHIESLGDSKQQSMYVTLLNKSLNSKKLNIKLYQLKNDRYLKIPIKKSALTKNDLAFLKNVTHTIFTLKTHSLEKKWIIFNKSGKLQKLKRRIFNTRFEEEFLRSNEQYPFINIDGIRYKYRILLDDDFLVPTCLVSIKKGIQNSITSIWLNHSSQKMQVVAGYKHSRPVEINQFFYPHLPPITRCSYDSRYLIHLKLLQKTFSTGHLLKFLKKDLIKYSFKKNVLEHKSLSFLQQLDSFVKSIDSKNSLKLLSTKNKVIKIISKLQKKIKASDG